MTRVLVTGATGMLGRDLTEVFADLEVVARPRLALDITDVRAVDEAVRGVDVVVNAAGWTDVDGAEEHEAAATRVNGTGPALLARACAEHGVRLVHVSTDYVFDGAGTTPYAEDAAPSPRSAYGRSKLAGERAVLETLPDKGYVVRTAWLYGAQGHNFVRTMMRLARQRDTVEVVDDQHGQPTWSRDVAVQIRRLLDASAPPGIYHATSSGETTWCGLARAVFEELGLDPQRVRPVTTAQMPRPAPRPAYSVLGHDRWAAAGVPPIRHWREALAQAMPLLRSDS